MARRRRSFLFDNISRKLVTNTFKTVQQVFEDQQNGVIANTDILTSAQIETKVESLSIANLHEDSTPQLGGTLDANNNIIDMGTNTITDTVVGQWNTAYGWGDHEAAGYAANTYVNTQLGLKADSTTVNSNLANTNAYIASNYTTLWSALTSTNTSIRSSISSEVASLVDSAPDALNTLNELAAALGDDSNFSTTVTNSIATKAANTYVNTQLSLKTDTTTFNAFVANTNTYIATKADTSSLASVATSGSYNDLSDVPSTAVTNYLEVANAVSTYTPLTTFNALVANTNTYIATKLDSSTYTASAASGITATNISNWDTAYGWGNHASAGYYVNNTSSNLSTNRITWANKESTDVTADGHMAFDLNDASAPASLGTYGSTNPSGWYFYSGGNLGRFWTDEHFNGTHVSNWQTAYGWGNHATQNYAVTTGDTFTGELALADSVRVRFDNTNDSNYDVTLGSYYDYDGWFRLTDGGGVVRFSVGRDNQAYLGGAGTAGNKVWNAGNDGSGSGLDADLLDGIQASSFLRSDANDTTTGKYTITTNSGFSIPTSGDTLTSGLQIFQGTAGADAAISFHISNDFAAHFGLDGGINDFAVGGWSMGAASYRVWHAGNDGSGSGLDADTLDGTQLSAIKTNSATDSNNIWIRNGSPTIYFRDTDHRGAMLHNNSNLFYILRGSEATDSTTWGTVNGMWPVYWNLTNNDAIFGGNITAQYDITAYSSDERLKTNIKPIENAIDKVKQIKGVTFDWNDKADELGFKPETKFNDVGMLAQDLEKVMPQLVKLAPFDTFSPDPNSKEDQSHKMGTSKSGENYKTIQYDRVCALLVEAIKELNAKVESLEGQLNGNN